MDARRPDAPRAPSRLVSFCGPENEGFAHGNGYGRRAGGAHFAARERAARVRAARRASRDDLPVARAPRRPDHRHAARSGRRPRGGRLCARGAHAGRGDGDRRAGLHECHHVASPMPTSTARPCCISAARRRFGMRNRTRSRRASIRWPSHDPITKWAHQITTPAQIPRLVAQAVRLATSAPTGPVLLDLPMDVLTAAVDESTVRIPENVVLDSPAAPASRARR